MKIAFTTVDLFKGREYLMPWRTVMEVVKRMRSAGMEADVVSVPVSPACECGSSSDMPLVIQELHIKKAPRDFGLFCKFVEDEGYDVVIYPTPWRESLKGDFRAFADLKCRKIAYFPGGVYGWANNLALWRWGGLSVAKPYIIDTLTPYKRFANLMRSCGFEWVVGLSPYTAETVKRAGFEKSICILPGKDDFDQIPDATNVFERLGLNTGEKYLLFTGAPAPTRGAQVVAEACKMMAKQGEIDGITKVVFLMRKDVGSDFSVFQKSFDKIENKSRVQLILEKVSREELKTLMAHARGVMLPFLVVPSEIPITFFEVLSLGVPIITFDNGGTTAYLKDALLTCKSGCVKGLVTNMRRLWCDDALHTHLSGNALRIMAKHPTWDEVAAQWMDLIKGIDSKE